MVDATAAARSTGWWWQRRPTPGQSRFGRAVWWAGHVQLPIALVLVLVCLPGYLAGAASGAPFPGSPWIGLAMAGPFAMSGLMLRASSEWQLYWEGPLGGGLVQRIAALVATVAGIAALSIALTVFAAYLLLLVGSAIMQSS